MTLKKLNRKKFNLGFNTKGEAVGIDATLRPEHVIIYGADVRAKECLMIELAKEAVQQKGGATFIVETPYLAGALYMILKDNRKKREVRWLNPEHSLGIKNQALWLEDYNETIFDQYVFNYQAEIESNSLVILDMETLKNGKQSLKVKRMLLKHLIKKLMKASPTSHSGHDIYMESLEGFEEELRSLILYGPSLNCSVRLIAESPKVFGETLPSISSYFRHTLLLPQFNIGDSVYYKTLMGISDDKILYHRAEDVALFSTRDESGERKLKRVNLPKFDNDELSFLIANGKRAKSSVYREFTKQEDMNNKILEAQNIEISKTSDWRQSAQQLVSLSTPSIPKHPNMLK